MRALFWGFVTGGLLSLFWNVVRPTNSGPVAAQELPDLKITSVEVLASTSVEGIGVVKKVSDMKNLAPGLNLLEVETEEDGEWRKVISAKSDNAQEGDRVRVEVVRVLEKKKTRIRKNTVTKTAFEFPFVTKILPPRPEKGKALPLPIAPTPSQLK